MLLNFNADDKARGAHPGFAHVIRLLRVAANHFSRLKQTPSQALAPLFKTETTQSPWWPFISTGFLSTFRLLTDQWLGPRHSHRPMARVTPLPTATVAVKHAFDAWWIFAAWFPTTSQTFPSFQETWQTPRSIGFWIPLGGWRATAYAYVCMYMYMLYMHLCVYVHTYTCVCVCLCTWCVCICLYMYTIYTHVCM
jgi:hypothetical protein